MNHQFTVKHKHSSSFSISVSRFNFHQLLLFYTKEYLSYERKLASFLSSRDSVAITFTSSHLPQNLKIILELLSSQVKRFGKTSAFLMQENQIV